MRLFMYQAFVDSVLRFTVVSSYHVCDMKLPEILSYTLFFTDDWNTRVRSVIFLSRSAVAFVTLCGTFYVSLCISLCIDLIIMLKRPFLNKDSLINIYVCYSILAALVMTTIALRVWNRININFKYVQCGLITSVIIFYLGIIVYSTVFACMKLSEPGISSEVRRLVLLRHVMTMLTWVLVNLYPMVGFSVATMPRWQGQLPEFDGLFWRVLKVLG